MKLEIIGTKFSILSVLGEVGIKNVSQLFFPQARLAGSTVAAYVLAGHHPYIPFFLLAPTGLGSWNWLCTYIWNIGVHYYRFDWIGLDWIRRDRVYLLANMGVVYYILLKACISFFLEPPKTMNHNKIEERPPIKWNYVTT